MPENGDKKRSWEKTPSAPNRGKGLDPTVQKQIGKRLQQLYDGVLDEPIPDRFIELLKQLEKSSKPK